MSDNKLDKWLSGEGLFAGKAKKAAPTSKPAEERSTKAEPKKAAPKKPVAKKEPKFKKAAPSAAMVAKNNAPAAPKRKSNNGGGGRRGFKRAFENVKSTNNDPTLHRPTAEKRDKFHPTNFIKSSKKPAIKIVPLGGMEQVGMNMMFLEWDNDIVVIDTGLVFPSAEHLGVDALIPDISYLIERKDKIRGVIFTHGHLDHVGGAPYMLGELGYPPCYATRLTKELLMSQCEEWLDTKRVKVHEITPKSKLQLGNFNVEFFHINHSIPDGVGMVFNTPYGAITHSSDFKFDYNPADDQPSDLGRIAEIGAKGVVLAMNDSTNAMKPGHTQSERIIENELADIINATEGRIVMATFASNVGRVAKVVEAAEKAGRTVYLSGRSMERNIGIARKLNYLNCREKTLQRMGSRANKENPNKVMILCTGSQGEELAALTRMAAGVHRDVKLNKDDTIIFSSSPIPGNGAAVVSVLNNLADIGCKVIDDKSYNTHVSGHGMAEECKLMFSLLNPKYFAPIHGEVFMRHGHKKLIVDNFDLDPKKAFIMKNGQGVILDAKGIRMMKDSEAVRTGDVFVQLGEKAPEKLLQDRRNLAEYGIVMARIDHEKGKVKNITFRARGFLYMNLDHEIYKLLDTELRKTWDRTYDPARKEKSLEAPLSQVAQKLIMQKFRKETIVEVVV